MACRLLSPRGFLGLAGILAVAYWGCDLAGWREYTSFLSGTFEAGRQGDVGVMLGAVYVLAYLGFVLIAPVLVLAAAVFAILLRAANRRNRP
jgi:hypothetical protein